MTVTCRIPASTPRQDALSLSLASFCSASPGVEASKERFSEALLSDLKREQMKEESSAGGEGGSEADGQAEPTLAGNWDPGHAKHPRAEDTGRQTLALQQCPPAGDSE